MALWVFWLILGVLLCLAELIFPTAFLEFAMGLSALLVSMVTGLFPSFVLQAALWLIVSVGLTLLLRRFVPKRKPTSLNDSLEAQTLTAIPAGEKGRVLYEGNSWSASCADRDLAIGPNEKVLVLRREGTMLIVMPQRCLEP